jgi:hypothetical protein
LLGLQKDNGLFAAKPELTWTPAGKPIRGAEDCWVMAGLAYTELPMTGDAMKKGVEAILTLDLDMTYAVAPRLIALCHLYPRLDRERKQRAKDVILRDLAWLTKAQGAEGQWDYASLDGKSTKHWDFSNTQMAILAYSEAIAAGFEIPNDIFLKAQNLHLQFQCPDGGWPYGDRGGFQASGNARDSYGSMTAACVASLYIIRDYLYRDLGCPCSGGRSRLRPSTLDAAINRGVAWLGQKYTVNDNPGAAQGRWTLYWLYSCERVGMAAGIKYFGTHNWYAEGAEKLVRAQQADGSWLLGGEGLADTVYGLCFLVKGRAPLLYNKLQFDGQWDNHPRDLANLVRYLVHQKEQPLRWQVINLSAPVEEWTDAPILYISAETVPELTAEHKKKLRQFTDSGGTILFEASCGATAVRTWWVALCKEVWPEWELKRLDKNHPVLGADQKIAKPIPSIEEMHDGVRSIVFYAPSDLSCAWATFATGNRRELFDFAGNLYFYATDRAPLRARLAGRHAVDTTSRNATLRAGQRTSLAVARVMHGGDHYVGRNYRALATLSATLQSSCRVAITEAGEKKPGELKPAEAPVAWLTGRQGVTLTEEELAALTGYLDGGGFLFVEAALGDSRFNAAFVPLAKRMGLRLLPILANDGLITGQMTGAAGYAVQAVKFKTTLMAERIGKPQPELYGLYREDRLVGLYSPLDLSYAATGCDAWGNRGYTEEDATAILTNIFLLISGR